MKQKIYIAAVNAEQSGGEGAKKWTRYSVKDSKGITYTTFEGKYVGMVGQEVELDIQDVPSKKINPKTNQPYINKNTIVEPKPSNQNEQRLKDLEMAYAVLDRRVTDLENGAGANMVQAIRAAKESEPEENLPF